MENHVMVLISLVGLATTMGCVAFFLGLRLCRQSVNDCNMIASEHSWNGMFFQGPVGPCGIGERLGVLLIERGQKTRPFLEDPAIDLVIAT